jgi:hypothetical protein
MHLQLLALTVFSSITCIPIPLSPETHARIKADLMAAGTSGLLGALIPGGPVGMLASAAVGVAQQEATMLQNRVMGPRLEKEQREKLAEKEAEAERNVTESGMNSDEVLKNLGDKDSAEVKNLGNSNSTAVAKKKKWDSAEVKNLGNSNSTAVAKKKKWDSAEVKNLGNSNSTAVAKKKKRPFFKISEEFKNRIIGDGISAGTGAAYGAMTASAPQHILINAVIGAGVSVLANEGINKFIKWKAEEDLKKLKLEAEKNQTLIAEAIRNQTLTTKLPEMADAAREDTDAKLPQEITSDENSNAVNQPQKF